jgi:hypothetical protein
VGHEPDAVAGIVVDGHLYVTTYDGRVIAFGVPS